MLAWIVVNKFNLSIVNHNLHLILSNKTKQNKHYEKERYLVPLFNRWRLLSNCLNPLEISRVALVWRELSKFWSIDLPLSFLWQISKTTVLITNYNALRTISWKYFRFKSLGSQFLKFQLFWIPRAWRDFFRMNQNFIHQMPPCLLAWMVKLAWHSNQALKCFIYLQTRWI